MKVAFKPGTPIVPVDAPLGAPAWGKLVRYELEGFYLAERAKDGRQLIVHENDVKVWQVPS